MHPDLMARRVLLGSLLGQLENWLSVSIGVDRNEISGGFVGNSFGPLPQATAAMRRRQVARRPWLAGSPLYAAPRRARIRPGPRPRASGRRIAPRSRPRRISARNKSPGSSRSGGSDDPEPPDLSPHGVVLTLRLRAHLLRRAGARRAA
jgi:hypothetical protein